MCRVDKQWKREATAMDLCYTLLLNGYKLLLYICYRIGTYFYTCTLSTLCSQGLSEATNRTLGDKLCYLEVS